MQKETIKFLLRTEDALVRLGKEIPGDKFDWRPSESVRTVGQVILHTAASNYFIMMNLGVPVPPDINLMNMESIHGKDQIISTLSHSFQFIYDHLLTIKEKELSLNVKFPFGE